MIKKTGNNLVIKDSLCIFSFVKFTKVNVFLFLNIFSCFLSEFLATSDSNPPLTFAQLPFSHPLFIMYSSGTTGAPKCICHSQGGTLMKHLEEHVLQGNINRDSIMMYYTTVSTWRTSFICILLMLHISINGKLAL